ncbi:MAG: T9SS type A sorting domain-containing protein [Calditrichaeota bacterium]|nr:T9SS type A sorting domain-containing protein [Calditrichota bacterium]
MRNLLYTILLTLFLAGMCSAEIVFSEDFEEGRLDEMAKRYSHTDNLEGMSLSVDVPQDSEGNQSLMMTSEMGQNYGGSLYKMFEEGYDSLFVRYYVKFAVTQHPIHHFVGFGGNNPPSRSPYPCEGKRPNGDDRFSTELVPFSNLDWVWMPCTYWMNMRRIPSIYYLGNIFLSDPPNQIKRGEWLCIEQMIKCNIPVDSYSGEQAFWINGELILHLGEGFPNGNWIWNQFHLNPDSAAFEGFQWRNDEDLNINYLWLQYYMQEGNRGQRDTCWFDDIVVATEYIGPLGDNDIIEEEVVFPESIDLEVYPNPFNSALTIRYSISMSENISLLLFDVNGREIAVIDQGVKSAGQHSVVYSNSNLTSGLYLIKLTSARQTTMKKALLIR